MKINFMFSKGLWTLMAIMAVLIGFYPAIYFILDPKFGLLSTKSNELLMNTYWQIAFKAHIVCGGIALLIGWSQFSVKFRNNYLKLHKNIGKAYVLLVILSSLSGIYIGFDATGGLVSALGFISLGIIWFCTTILAYVHILNKRILSHQKMMIFSYAACFAAVTLRIWLPMLTSLTGDFITAYTIVAWICWIPNIIVAYFLTKRLA